VSTSGLSQACFSLLVGLRDALTTQMHCQVCSGDSKRRGQLSPSAYESSSWIAAPCCARPASACGTPIFPRAACLGCAGGPARLRLGGDVIGAEAAMGISAALASRRGGPRQRRRAGGREKGDPRTDAGCPRRVQSPTGEWRYVIARRHTEKPDVQTLHSAVGAAVPDQSRAARPLAAGRADRAPGNS